MRIILHELRKIFNWKIVSVLILISCIFYQLFMSFFIEHFPNGRPELDYYNVSVEMIKNYGTSMDEQEFGHFVDRYEQEVERATSFLQERKEFVDAGIATYEQFRHLDEAENEAIYELRDRIMFKEVGLFWELQAREYIINQYKFKDVTLDNYNNGNLALLEAQQERMKEIFHQDDVSFFPYIVYENYNNLIFYETILILLSMFALLSPLFIKDKKHKIDHLQYTSKTGRTLFKQKIFVSLIAAFIVTTVQLGVFFSVYSLNDVSSFLSFNINSFFNFVFFWYDFTFIQYISLTVLAIYVLSFVFALLIAVISSVVPNYLTVIGAQVPLAFFTFGYALDYFVGRMTDVLLSPYLLPICYTLLVMLAISTVILRWKKEKTADIVT